MSASEDDIRTGPSIASSIWRDRYMVALAVVLSGALGYWLSALQPASYVASATLTLRDPAAPGALTVSPGAGMDLDRRVQQQADVMTSRAVLDAAAEALGATATQLANTVEAEADPELAKITITAAGANAEIATARANAIADTYQALARRSNTEEIEAANSVFQEQIKQLRKEQRDLEKELKGVDLEDRDPVIESRLQTLSGEITALQTQTTELAANGAVFGAGIRAREQALPPEEPASPQPARDAAVLAAIGFGFASAVAYWRQGRSRRVETRVDAASVLDVPLLGEIPKFSRSGALSGGEPVLGGEASEAYEFVLSSIEFALADIGGSSILITSAAPGDGKTITALHVAMASARESRRVTLVDTDVRAHGLTTLLRAERHPGLVQLAAGDVSLEECVRRFRLSDTVQLNVVPSGAAPETSTGLMRAPEFKRAIQHIKQRSELVVLDSAPLLAVADATVIATQVDAIVLVVDSRTPIDQLQKVHERLTFVPTPVLGYVYNRADTPRSARYGYGYGSNGHGAGRRFQRFNSVTAGTSS